MSLGILRTSAFPLKDNISSIETSSFTRKGSIMLLKRTALGLVGLFQVSFFALIA